MRKYVFLTALISLLLINSLCSINKLFLPKYLTQVSKASTNNFKIKQRNPVVNEGNRIQLSVVSKDGKNITEGIMWRSGSPDIAAINATTGEVFGLKSGFATITASRGDESFSVFVVVAKVRKVNGTSVPGDTKTDNKGSVYISNPLQNVILKADNSLGAPLQPFAGKQKVAGNRNGSITEALFAGPTAIGVDNSANGGIYVADTLNHSIRKIGFDRQVETILGKGFPGVSSFSVGGNEFSQVFLSSPRGVVADNGGNLYIADTDNNAIYYADFSRRKVTLVAGEPGTSGKQDGLGRSAKFKRPSGMALSNDGRLLSVADEDNDRVRLIELLRDNNGEIVGNVSTLGVATSSQGVKNSELNQASDEIVFEHPLSVSIDGTGNIYVVDNQGVQLVTRPFGQMPEVVALAQPDVTFNKAVSVTVSGTQAFVLDSGSISPTEALSIVSVAGPEINSIQPAQIRLNENTEVVVTGKNFAPESQIVFGGKIVTPSSIKAEEIRFQAPAQTIPGAVTFSVLTRGGIAQQELNIVAKPSSMLAPGEITTIAGGTVSLGNGGQATLASLSSINKVILDSLGNIFIVDTINKSIRRVDKQTGVITSVAGGGTSLADGVLAVTALINPTSIALDKAGNIFIADELVNGIRKIDALNNTITTIAGSSGRRFGGDGGLAIDAGFDGIRDLAVDQNGNLLVLEQSRLRRIDAATKVITTIAGNGIVVFTGDGGPATKAGFAAGTLAVDNNNNIYINDTLNGRIRKINKDGIITTVAGNGPKRNIQKTSYVDGTPATKVSLIFPRAIAVDTNNNLFITSILFLAKQNNIFLTVSGISKVDLATGTISRQTINIADDDKALSTNTSVTSLVTDGLGNIIFATYNGASTIFSLDSKSGNAVRIVGNKRFNFFGDTQQAQTASIGTTFDIASDQNGNIYLVDVSNNLIRSINTNTGIIDTLVGKDTNGTVGNGDGGTAEKAIIFPSNISLDKQGNLLISDFQNGRSFIRKVDLNTKIISTIAGSTTSTFQGNGKPALKTDIFFPIDQVVSDSQGNIYFITEGLKKIDAKTGIISSIPVLGDSLQNLIISKDDVLFLTGSGVSQVFSYDTKTGKTSVVAGNKSNSFSGDGGLATQAGLGSITGLALDKQGNLFIAASVNGMIGQDLNVITISKIRKVDAKTGIINSVVGNKDGVYSGDGGLASDAGLSGIVRITIDSKNNLFLSTISNGICSVRQVKLPN